RILGKSRQIPDTFFLTRPIVPITTQLSIEHGRARGICSRDGLTGETLSIRRPSAMSSPSPVGIWVSQLKEGDPQAAQLLWNTYFFRMVKVARCKLHGAPA